MILGSWPREVLETIPCEITSALLWCCSAHQPLEGRLQQCWPSRVKKGQVTKSFHSSLAPGLKGLMKSGHMSDLGRCSFKGAQEWTNCHRCPKSPRLWKYKLLCNDGWRTFSSNCVISWDAIGHFFRITVDKGIDPLKSASLECVCVCQKIVHTPQFMASCLEMASWKFSGT